MTDYAPGFSKRRLYARRKEPHEPCDLHERFMSETYGFRCDCHPTE